MGLSRGFRCGSIQPGGRTQARPSRMKTRRGRTHSYAASSTSAARMTGRSSGSAAIPIAVLACAPASAPKQSFRRASRSLSSGCAYGALGRSCRDTAPSPPTGHHSVRSARCPARSRSKTRRRLRGRRRWPCWRASNGPSRICTVSWPGSWSTGTSTLTPAIGRPRSWSTPPPSSWSTFTTREDQLHHGRDATGGGLGPCRASLTSVITRPS